HTSTRIFDMLPPSSMRRDSTSGRPSSTLFSLPPRRRAGRGEWQVSFPKQPQALPEVAAVTHQIPITGKPPHLLQGGEIDQLILQNLVGRLRIIDHFPLSIVAHDRRPPQPLQNPNLYLLGIQLDQSIKSC